MIAAPRLEQPFIGVYRWTVYSPEHRVELTSHAVESPAGLVIFDPIPLAPEGWEAWNPGRKPSAIVLTNANHVRAAAAWQERLQCPLFAPPEVAPELHGSHRFTPSPCPLAGWNPFPLPGGAPGETAFSLPERSLVVFGDAVVHLASRGLELLPDKYCTDPAELRASLRHLLSQSFERALFAHGDPLPTSASARLRALL